MQKTTLIGNIGKGGAQIIQSKTGKFLSFSVCENYVSKDGVEHAIWYKVSTSDISLLDMLKQGTPVYIEGRLSPYAYIDPTTNALVATLNLKAFYIWSFGQKSSSESDITPTTAENNTEASNN